MWISKFQLPILGAGSTLEVRAEMVDKQPDGEEIYVLCSRGHQYSIPDGVCLACELQAELAAQDPCICCHVFEPDDFEDEINNRDDPNIFKAFCPICEEIICREV